MGVCVCVCVVCGVSRVREWGCGTGSVGACRGGGVGVWTRLHGQKRVPFSTDIR